MQLLVVAYHIFCEINVAHKELTLQVFYLVKNTFFIDPNPR